MKVACYRAYGGPENVDVTDLPEPVAGEGQLLVRVRASSVNPVDWKIARGDFPFNLVKPGLPYVPGHDVAGEVVRGAGDFREGDRVYARIPGTKGGTSAERVAFDARAAAKMPEGMGYHEAAAIPLAALTALQGLTEQARLPTANAEGWRVLVIGASGGVGHFAVQIARAVGAHVTGVCSGRNAEMVTGLGAHEVIDYTKVTTWNAGGNFDVILDCVGGESPSRFTPWLTKRGSYANTLPDGGVFARQVLGSLGLGPRVRAVMLRPDGDGLRWLNGLYEKKQFRAVIDEVFALDKLADAHRKSMTGRARGKIVVSVSE